MKQSMEDVSTGALILTALTVVGCGALIWAAIIAGWIVLGSLVPKPCSVYPLECRHANPPGRPTD